MYFKIQPFTPLQRVFDAVAKRKDAAVETLCFVLDGSRVRGHLTLEDLDITAESTSTACLWRMRHPTSFCRARPRRSALPLKPRRPRTLAIRTLRT